MTTSDELRGRIAATINEAFDTDWDYLVYGTDLKALEIFGGTVDAILAEIEAAGYVIWPKEKARRVLNDATACDYDCQCEPADFEMRP